MLVGFGLLAAACGSGVAGSERIAADAVLPALAAEGGSTDEEHPVEAEGEGSDTEGAETEDEGEDPHDEDFWFGEPADPAEATMIIEIEATDDFRFGPSTLTFKVGDVVTFRVTNTGELPHEFTIGDSAVQDAHEAEMMAAATEMEGMEMAMNEGGMDGDPNAIAVEAGETAEITWKFTTPGWVMMGCHVPGHYIAGMMGVMLVEA